MIEFIPILGDIVNKIFGVVDKAVEDKDAANKIKQEILSIQTEASTKVIESQKDIIVAEAKGESWLQRNWRPLLMLCITLIIFNNYLFVPYASIWTDKVKILELPEKLWTLMELGVSGYIIGRSAEKIVPSLTKVLKG